MKNWLISVLFGASTATQASIPPPPPVPEPTPVVIVEQANTENFERLLNEYGKRIAGYESRISALERRVSALESRKPEERIVERTETIREVPVPVPATVASSDPRIPGMVEDISVLKRQTETLCKVSFGSYRLGSYNSPIFCDASWWARDLIDLINARNSVIGVRN